MRLSGTSVADVWRRLPACCLLSTHMHSWHGCVDAEQSLMRCGGYTRAGC